MEEKTRNCTNIRRERGEGEKIRSCIFFGGVEKKDYRGKTQTSEV